MQVRIDMREHDLIQLITQMVQTTPKFSSLTVSTENLPLGDIIISSNDTDHVIIERKSVSDLSASIKDGRYDEQSYRLNGLEHPNHQILYLIEGSLQSSSNLSWFKEFPKDNHTKDNSMLYSAICSLQFFKGFSLMRTDNMQETATYICHLAVKVEKELSKGKALHVQGVTTNDKSYTSVVKKVKKENITAENISEVMLCQIPGISATIARAVFEQFHTLPRLVQAIQNNPNCIDGLQTVDANGKKRKISKTVLENIKLYLSSLSA